MDTVDMYTVDTDPLEAHELYTVDMYTVDALRADTAHRSADKVATCCWFYKCVPSRFQRRTRPDGIHIGAAYESAVPRRSGLWLSTSYGSCTYRHAQLAMCRPDRHLRAHCACKRAPLERRGRAGQRE
eukprot:176193-Pleurochrysis_carterae.AAC.1